MSNFNLDEMLAQRAEATGIEEGRVAFDFTARSGEHEGELMTFTIRDNMTLSADEIDELEQLGEDGDVEGVSVFWMGEDEYDRFCEAGGGPMMLRMIIEAKAEAEQGVKDGRPTRRNRSQRRAAARRR